MRENSYALIQELESTDYDAAVESVVEAMSEQGFGVLTEIDVKATLKQKLDVDFRRYVILGGCNPALAHQALTGEPMLGVLLPCNVVVAERDEGGSVVAAMRPISAFELVGNPDIQPIAEEVESRLRTVLERVAAG